MVLYRIEGGGHTWPNGLQYLPEKILGKVCRDLNGSEVICRQTSEVSGEQRRVNKGVRNRINLLLAIYGS